MTAATDRKMFDRLAGGGYALTLFDQAVRLEIRHLRRDHHQLTGELDCLCEWSGASTYQGSLSCADLNLSSQTARKARALYVAERAKTKPGEFDWVGVLDEICRLVIQAERAGDDVIVLDDAPVTADRDFDVNGLLVPADSSSMIIAHGDTLKSIILLLTLGTLAKRGSSVLWLDWEWTAARHAARKRRLFGPARLENLRYLRCVAPLTIEADRIRRFCDEHHVDYIGVDSVGLACDGKLADDDTAIRFHRALSSLPPSMSAAHVPKSAVGPDVKDAIGPFGSVFFSNLCRASWLLKKQPGATDDVVTVGAYPQKQNDGDRHRPVGLEFTFTDERIGVRSVNLAGVDGLAQGLPLGARIAHLLKRGPLTYAQIAEALDAKVGTVVKTANRQDRTFTKVTNSEDGILRIALVQQQVTPIRQVS